MTVLARRVGGSLLRGFRLLVSAAPASTPRRVIPVRCDDRLGASRANLRHQQTRAAQRPAGRDRQHRGDDRGKRPHDPASRMNGCDRPSCVSSFIGPAPAAIEGKVRTARVTGPSRTPIALNSRHRGGTVTVVMRPVLSLVLSLLMLAPGGVCTCEGGPRACPDHPVSAHEGHSAALGDEHESGCCKAATDTHARLTAHDHRCPAPLPHDPSCLTAASVAPAESTPAIDSDLAACPVLVPHLLPWCPEDSSLSRPRAGQPPAPSPPLFVRHCAFLI